MGRFNEFGYRYPLMEGKVPGTDRDGSDYVPPEDTETDTCIITGEKDEYYAHETICKACRCRFIAWSADWKEHVRRFCPGCGKQL